MQLPLRVLLPLASLSAVSRAVFLSGPGDYAFPDCVNGPLKNNTVCNPSADYMDRASALVSVLSLEELECNVIDATCGSERWGLPRYVTLSAAALSNKCSQKFSYEWWSEALHGLAGSPGVTFAPVGQAYGSASQFPNGKATISSAAAMCSYDPLRRHQPWRDL
jgi:hypothetical protein